MDQNQEAYQEKRFHVTRDVSAPKKKTLAAKAIRAILVLEYVALHLKVQNSKVNNV
jgi:hypothetical protein